MSKTIDIFLFYNELEMLDARLEYLNDYVDHFVLVESNITFSGNAKPMFYLENKDRYKKYQDKIIYAPFITDPANYKFPRPGEEYADSGAWLVERGQFNSPRSVLNQFDDEDMILHSCIDEVPDVRYFDQMREMIKVHNIMAFDTTYLVYNLDTMCLLDTSRSMTRHCTTRSCLNKVAKSMSFQDIRRPEYPHCIPAGWHFTYFMPPEKIQLKIESYSHTSENVDHIKNVERLEQCIRNKIFFVNNGWKLIPTNTEIAAEIPEIFRKYFGYLSI